MKLYRQVSTSERMPDKDGDYITSLGIVPFYEQKFNIYIFDNRIDSMWWLEEVQMPNEEQVFELIKKDCKNEFDFYHAGLGASAVISLLKG